MQPLDAEEIHAAVDQAVALEDQGLLENARGRYAELLAALDLRALAASPDEKVRWAGARAAACYASLLLDLEEARAALEIAEVSLGIWESAPYWSLIGQCHRELGDKEQARRAYRRSAELGPRPGAWVLLFSVAENDAERLACLEKALELDPNYDEAHYNLGVQFRLARDFASARHHLERAIALDPNYAIAYAELGWTLHESARTLGDTERARALRTTAVTHLERALALEPKLYWGRLYLALAMHALDRLRAAKLHYETAVRLHADESLPHALYGDFLGARYGNVPLAERHLRKAVELDSEDPTAHFYLGKFLKRRGDHAEARRHLLQADALGHEAALALLEEDDDE